MMCCPDNTPSGSAAGPLAVAAVVGLALVVWVLRAIARGVELLVAWPGWRAVGLALVVVCTLTLGGIAAAAVQSRRRPARVPTDPPRRVAEQLSSTVEVLDVERTGRRERGELRAPIPLPAVTPRAVLPDAATPAPARRQ